MKTRTVYKVMLQRDYKKPYKAVAYEYTIKDALDRASQVTMASKGVQDLKIIEETEVVYEVSYGDILVEYSLVPESSESE